MEWYRDPANRTQAGFARNAGLLLADYLALTSDRPPDERYEATLTLCVLQSLLTNCAELLRAMEDHHKTFFETVISDRPIWGLVASQITLDTFPGDPTLGVVLTHLRDGLSHPVVLEPAVACPATGYTTSGDPSGNVTAFRITDSPWVQDGERKKQFAGLSEKGAQKEAKKFEENFGDSGFLEVMAASEHGKFDIVRNGMEYWPLFVIELPLDAAKELAMALATRLAQPYDEAWDGRTLRELVARR